MKNFTYLKMLLLAIIMLVGSGNVLAQTETTVYSGDFNDSTGASGSYAPDKQITLEEQTWFASYVYHGSGEFRLGHNKAAGLVPSKFITTTPQGASLEMQWDIANVKTITVSCTKVYGTPSTWYIFESVDGGLTWREVATGTTIIGDWSYTATVPLASARYAFVQSGTGNPRTTLTDVSISTSSSVTPTVSIPTISISGEEKASNIYWNNAEVTLNTTTEDATIYYTLDGTEPDAGSTLYAAPFAITTTGATTIKAIGIKAAMDNSVIAEKTVTIAPPATATLPHNEVFNGNLGDWYAYSAKGDQKWTAEPISGDYASAAQMNGYSDGYNENEDWLISPEVTSSTGILLSFASYKGFTGDDLTLKYSTNYSGYGDPTTATWTDITNEATWATSTTWVETENLTIEETQALRLAFVYTSTTESATLWRITNVSIAKKPTAPTISVVETEIPAMKATVGKSGTQEINVNGLNLTGNIELTIEGTNSALFAVSPTSLIPTAGEVLTTAVTITYTPTENNGPHTATLKINSAGAEEITFPLTGNVISVPNVIITEVYGGGGNSGATYKNDYVELYNTTSSPIDISGWSLQYYSATGNGECKNFLVFPENTIIRAKNYYLVQLAGGENGEDFPVTPNYTGTLNLSGTNGKIILYATDQAQTITTEIASITSLPGFKDYVPFGSATPAWGSALNALSSSAAAVRKIESGEYVYTQNVGNDFEATTPAPQAGPIINLDTTELTFVSSVGKTAYQACKASGANLSGYVLFSIEGDDADLFAPPAAPLIVNNGIIEETYFAVTYTPTELGNHSAKLKMTFDGNAGEEYIYIDLSGTAVTPPAITVEEIEIPAFEAQLGESDTQTITVSGTNLTSNISISFSGTNADLFSSNPIVINTGSDPISDVGPVTVIITYNPTEAGEHSATITLSSEDAEDVSFYLMATCTPVPVPTINVDEIEIPAFEAQLGESDTQTITVSGTDLLSDISLRLEGDNSTYFTCSKYSLESQEGIVEATPITITYTPTEVGNHSATLIISSQNAEDIEFDLTATCTAVPLDIVSLTPANDAVEVSINPEIKVEFDQEVTIDLSTFSATIEDPEGTKLILTPVVDDKFLKLTFDGDLKNNTKYTVSVQSGIENYDQPIEWSFTTEEGEGIDDVLANMNVYANNGNIYFTTTEGLNISIYSVTGVCVYQGISNNGLNTIPMERGIYLITVDKKVNKVIVK